MLITKVERQKKHPSRVSIHIDHQFAIGIHKEVLLRSGLRVGDQISETTLEELKKLEELHNAKESAARLLSYRARSVKEMEDRLRKKRFDPDTTKHVIESLTRSGLLNDLDFARSFAHDKLLKKPIGKTLLKQQLRQKGISKELIEQVISETYTDDSEDEYALNLAFDRYRRFKTAFSKLDLQKRKKRLSDYLARRGFDWETVTKAVSQVLGQPD